MLSTKLANLLSSNSSIACRPSTALPPKVTSLSSERFRNVVTEDLVASYLRLGLAWQAVVESSPMDLISFASSPHAAETKFLAQFDRVFWMTRINVPRDFRRQGYGSVLLKNFCRLIDDNNIGLVCFPSSSDPSVSHEALCQFYINHGFRPVIPNVLFFYSKKDTPMQEAVANSPRSLVDVLDRMIAVAPDLEQHLKSVKSSATFAAPEMQPYWWQQAAVVLNQVAMQHEKAAQLMNIFAGKE